MDARVQVINQENQGLSNVRKVALQASNGKYIQFVDGDDWLELDACEKLYEQAEREQVDMLLFRFQRIFPNRIEKEPPSSALSTTKKHPFQLYVMGYFPPALWAKFISRNFLLDNNLSPPQNISYGEDFAFSAVICMHTPKISFSNDCLYNYLQRSSNLSSNINGYFKDYKKKYSYIYHEFEQCQLSSSMQEYIDLLWIEYLCHLHMKALKVNDEKNIQLLTREINNAKCKISFHIKHKKPLFKMIFSLHHYHPNIIIWFNKVRMMRFQLLKK